MRVIGYVRVSTNEQAENGVSLAAQEQKIRSYCKGNGWQCVRVVRDDGYSAKDLKRPGLQHILAEFPARKRRFDGIVVAKLDRLTRSVRDLVRLTDDANKHQVVLVSIQEAVGTGTATGQIFRDIVTSISQWERGIIGERTARPWPTSGGMGNASGRSPMGLPSRRTENTWYQTMLRRRCWPRSRRGANGGRATTALRTTSTRIAFRQRVGGGGIPPRSGASGSLPESERSAHGSPLPY